MLQITRVFMDFGLKRFDEESTRTMGIKPEHSNNNQLAYFGLMSYISSTKDGHTKVKEKMTFVQLTQFIMDKERPTEVTLFAVLLMAKLLSVEDKVDLVLPDYAPIYERCMTVILECIG